MTIDLATAWKPALAVIAAAVLMVVGYQWLQEHDARLKAESVQAAQGQVIAQAQTQIADAKAATAKIAGDLQTQLNTIAAERQTVPTPQQVVVDVSKLIPSLPVPMQVQNVPATATAPATQALVVPQEDLPALQNYKLDCDAKSAELDACTLTAAQTKIMLAGDETEIRAVTTQRDQWKAAAQGGTLWHRVLHTAKWVGITAGVGVVAYEAGKVGK